MSDRAIKLMGEKGVNMEKGGNLLDAVEVIRAVSLSVLDCCIQHNDAPNVTGVYLELNLSCGSSCWSQLNSAKLEFVLRASFRRQRLQLSGELCIFAAPTFREIKLLLHRFNK